MVIFLLFFLPLFFFVGLSFGTAFLLERLNQIIENEQQNEGIIAVEGEKVTLSV